MAAANGPVLVREPRPRPGKWRPGLHSHNSRRSRTDGRPPHSSDLLRYLRTALLIFGLAALGYYGYTVANEYISQKYENWAFDQEVAGRKVTFSDYLREGTPLGLVLGRNTRATIATTSAPERPSIAEPARPALGAVLGRIQVERLHLSAMVREGVDTKVLSSAVGHVPSTALAGETGNFAIAAHRDTLFRALKDIRRDDLITFQSSTGTYTYRVEATKIVNPTDVSVLRADGGGLVSGAGAGTSSDKLLTMITCYPFYYVGSAPKRFIVEAALVNDKPETPSADNTQRSEAVAAAPPARIPLARGRPAHQKHANSAELRRNRGSSTLRAQSSTTQSKRRGVWHRVVHF